MGPHPGSGINGTLNVMSGNLSRQPASTRRSTLAILVLAFAAFAAVVAADYLTSYTFSLSAFYVLVILAVSWFCGAWWGSLFVFLSVYAQIQIMLSLGNLFSEPLFFYVGNGNKLFAYLVIAFLTSAVRTAFTRARAAARVDYLTGITNRIGFYEKVSVEMARHRRDPHPFAVAYIDCDHFKVLNDGLGHSEGDRVLEAVGQTLNSKLRETDIVARLGGNEFAVVMPQTSEFAALHVIRKLRRDLDSAMEEHEWPITFSIGLGLFPSVPENVDRVIAFSDKLLYRVKAMGKNKTLHRVYERGEPGTTAPTQLGEADKVNGC